MKKVILTLVILFSLTGASAQKWEQTIGEPDQNEGSQRLIEHYDKGYIVTGLKWGGSNQTHGMLIKTDINGNVLWHKELGVDPDYIYTYKTIYDIDGNLYVFGTLKQGLPDEWPVTIKLNACGEK